MSERRDRSAVNPQELGRIDEYVRTLVDAWPPIPDDLKEDVRAIFASQGRSSE